jgi:dUTP pyrophosphatase
MNHKIKIVRLNDKLPLPTYATKHSAGIDLYASISEPIILKSKEYRLIPTGISIEMESCYEAQIRPRSGLAAKYGITVLNSPGTIDADYRGEIKVLLINHGNEDFLIEFSMKIAQMVIAKYLQVTLEEVNSLNSTDRADGGFGSTGT